LPIRPAPEICIEQDAAVAVYPLHLKSDPAAFDFTVLAYFLLESYSILWSLSIIEGKYESFSLQLLDGFSWKDWGTDIRRYSGRIKRVRSLDLTIWK